ncbi:hypothetical protein CABS03_13028 [Colletotrichum abscissum]
MVSEEVHLTTPALIQEWRAHITATCRQREQRGDQEAALFLALALALILMLFLVLVVEAMDMVWVEVMAKLELLELAWELELELEWVHRRVHRRWDWTAWVTPW